MLLYEIVDDVHWLKLTVKHIKKSVLCAQDSFVRSLMPPMKQTFKLILVVSITARERSKDVNSAGR